MYRYSDHGDAWAYFLVIYKFDTIYGSIVADPGVVPNWLYPWLQSK